MYSLIISNLPTITVGAALLAVLMLIIRKMLKDKKNGKSSCGCSCADCPSKGMCHPKE